MIAVSPSTSAEEETDSAEEQPASNRFPHYTEIVSGTVIMHGCILCLLDLLCMFRIVIGLLCFVPPYPHTLALYQVSVRQTRCLPLTSFRFHLAMDTLVSLAIRFPLSGLVGDLHPLDITHAEHTQIGLQRFTTVQPFQT